MRKPLWNDVPGLSMPSPRTRVASERRLFLWQDLHGLEHGLAPRGGQTHLDDAVLRADLVEPQVERPVQSTGLRGHVELVNPLLAVDGNSQRPTGGIGQTSPLGEPQSHAVNAWSHGDVDPELGACTP